MDILTGSTIINVGGEFATDYVSGLRVGLAKE